MCYQWKGVHHREVGYAQSAEEHLAEEQEVVGLIPVVDQYLGS